METLLAIGETHCCEDRLRGWEREDDPKEFLGEIVMPEMSGVVRLSIGLRGFDGIRDSTGGDETSSVLKPMEGSGGG